MAKVRVWYRDLRKKWTASYRVPGCIPEKKITKSFSNKSDAYKYKEYTEYQLNYENWQGIQGMTWKAATRLFLDQKENYISKSTVKEFEKTFTRFSQLVGMVSTDILHERHIQDFINKRKKQKIGDSRTVSLNTINKDLRQLKVFTRWCYESHLCKTLTKVQMLKTTQKKYIPPSAKELQDILESSKNYYPLYARIVLAIATGLRREAIECIELNKNSTNYIDLEKGVIVTTETKTHDQRICRLGQNTINIINKHFVSLPDGTKKLFPDKWGGKARAFFETIRPKGLTFHKLRNIAVSALGDMGESAAVLQKTLNHKSYSTTEKYYFNINDETQKRITEKIDSLFNPV